MKKSFEHFPETAICPLCQTSDDQPCFLVPIDGTADGNICESQPTHVHCLQSQSHRLRYNRELGVMYFAYAYEDDE